MVEMKPHSFRVVDDEQSSDASRDHVGDFLREARENFGRSPSDIAAALRIRRSFVDAIEDGRFQDLPGPAYAAGFIRSYAEYLGLDAAVLVARFKAESSASEHGLDLDFPAPATTGWFPTGAVVASCVALAAAVFGGWYYLQSQNAIDIVLVPPLPGQPAANGDQVSGEEAPRNGSLVSVTNGASAKSTANGGPATAKAAASASNDDAVYDEAASTYRPPLTPALLVATDPLATPDTPRPEAADETPPADNTANATTTQSEPATTTDADTAATADIAVSAAPTVAVTAFAQGEPAPAQRAEAGSPLRPDPAPRVVPVQTASLPSIPVAARADQHDAGRTYGVINRNARVVITANADSWVQVLDNDQNVLLTRMLRPGDRYLVPDRKDLVMLTGNAGGLEIFVDGEQVPGIGADGAILHNVRLDVELLKTGRAVIR